MSAQTAPRSQQTTETKEQKLAKLKLLKAREALHEGLPHLYGFHLYTWQRKYIDSTEKINLICAGNQLGKSVCNVLKMVRWATDKTLWPKLWKNRPIQFWYLLPSKDLITTEFRTKWVPEILPRGEMKKHPTYGWREEYRNKHIWAIHFNSGVSIYFHSYEQDVHHLQGATVDAIFLDEEVPYELMPELMMRLNARNGYFNAVMTPTRGQEFWRKAFEGKEEEELMVDAYKQQVSMFDCRKYEDGTLSDWTDERITQTINRLGTQAEIDLRVHGKFTVAEGLKVPAFSREHNINKAITPIPDNWYWFSGVDLGGGNGGSLPAIVFVAIRPDYQFARITEVWRGDPTKLYTDLDVLNQYVDMRRQRPMAGEFYDFAAKDFGTFAHRADVAFMPAEKSHEIGFPLINSLFKNRMLLIDSTKPNQDLIMELVSLREGGNKKTAMDHATDAMRYAIAKVPWSLEGIAGDRIIETPKPQPTEMDRRLGRGAQDSDSDAWSCDAEYDLFNDIAEY